MMEKSFFIGDVPATVYGEKSEKIFLFVHGQCGSKEEAGLFAKTADKYGWQVIGIDLPEHNGRKDGIKLLPWNVVSELRYVMGYIKKNWGKVGVRANSIGTWFSLLAFAGEKAEISLFVSPLLDMENMILGMIKQTGVTECRLERKKEIKTDFGQVLSWDYLCWVRQHRVSAISGKTEMLYGTKDDIVPFETVEKFALKNHCNLTVMEGGEHWFHTESQLEFMKNWEEKILKGLG